MIELDYSDTLAVALSKQSDLEIGNKGSANCGVSSSIIFHGKFQRDATVPRLDLQAQATVNVNCAEECGCMCIYAQIIINVILAGQQRLALQPNKKLL
jgi:hypothetical protein